jgi:hypothetical protein
MIRFLKNYKIEIVIFFLLSFLIPYFVYMNEDKNTYYKGDINLANFNPEFKPIFKNFLSKNSNLYNNNIDIDSECDTNFVEENGLTLLQLSIKIPKTSKDKSKGVKRSKEICRKIIVTSFDQYIDFQNEVIDFYNNKEGESEYYKSYVFPKKVEIYNAIFFLTYTKNKINNESIDLIKTYQPSNIKAHLINLFFTVLIIFTLLAGFIIARKNLTQKKK